MAQFEIYCYSCYCEKCIQRDVYTGKAKHGIISRHKGHVSAATAILAGKGEKKHIKFDYFMAKHGIENLRYRVIEVCSFEDELNLREVYWIAELKTSFEYGGLNFDIGGKGGRKKGVWSPTIDHREKLRIANTGHIVSAEEQLRKFTINVELLEFSF